MMHFHVLTLFPDMIKSSLETGILGRAKKQGLLAFNMVNIRDYTKDKHGKVDDYTYGGGAGMLMQAQPVYDAWKSVTDKLSGKKARTIYVTPQGVPFTQKFAEELSEEEDLIFLCGHYEGVDERVLEEIVTDYVSIGDYVLTGGELPAMVMIDAVSRLIPGVLHNEASARTESFYQDLLEYPQYSRPLVWQKSAVPEVLLSGNHKDITAWRLEKSKERTKARRPDLYARYEERERLAAWLSKDKKSYADMLEILRRGTAVVLYHTKEAAAILDENSKTCMLTAHTEEEGKKMLSFLERRIPMPGQTTGLFSMHEKFLAEEMNARFPESVNGYLECIQMVYTKGVFVKGLRHVEVRTLDSSYLEKLIVQYDGPAGKDSIRKRLSEGRMFGAFLKGELAGFIGVHAEGGMGLLEVYETYRRQGVAIALEGYCINHLLSEGQTPFCHVLNENVPSIRLQEKLGLYPAKKKTWWLL